MRGETVAETLRAPGRAFLALLAPLFLLAVLAPSLARGDGFENGQGMEFVAVPAGSFWMGALDGDKEAMDWETPRHRVTISRPFYVGKYKVTRAQWNALAPPKGPGDNYPANFLTFGEIKTFIAKLNQLEKTSAYRLPTEAEWEYFARAGGESLYFYGDDPALMRDYADCPNDDITPVGL
ncbi:MAG: formylglycine-generating enzyme family protein, partial [Deltaproteobacteria bacterium]|nr:formylglycine-generating enzyme family protein [Deltaproteobacteria bacterium]